MNKRYGIFDNEVDAILEGVHRGHELAEIESAACPCCSAPLKVFFWPDGKGFKVSCTGEPPHFSRYEEIATPPSWWRERVGEVTEWLES